MTALNPSLASALMLVSGSADRVALYGLRMVNAGDTLDVGPSGAGQFQSIARVVVMTVTSSAVQIAAAFTGTVITMPSGCSNDMGYLLVWGASA
jgi:hypothetical protein